MTAAVRHDQDRSRYEYLLDGDPVGVAEYRRQDGVLVIHHTEVDPTRRGQGIGAELVRGALDDIRARGERIVPACWFVREFVDQHPTYRDLVVEQ